MAFDWKKALRTVAPALASALGTPAAGAATKILANILLPGKADPSEDELATKVENLTAADVLAIKAADYQFAKDMEAFRIQELQVDAGDRANARQREVLTKDVFPKILAAATLVTFYVLVFVLVRVPIPEANRSAFDITLGAVVGAVTTVMAYYFGSSSSSRAKDRAIGEALNTK